MKLITTLFAFSALTMVTSGFAQEGLSTPSQSPVLEEPASATIETTPEATPMEKASPAPVDKPTPSPAPSPAAQKKEAASPSPAPAAAKTGKKMSVEATLKDMENRWAEAYAKHDTTTMASLLADDYISVSSKGKVQNKRAALSEAKGHKETFTMTKNEKLDVRPYGSNVAVVVGLLREKGTGKDGTAFDRTFRFTDTWMERNGKWQCIAGQAMIVKER